MSTIYNSVTELIGNTPLLKLNRVVPEDAADVYVKLEFENPAGSTKDRIALAMIEKAERDGNLKPGGTITSRNTGIGLAMVAAAKGYHIIIVMPETMSVERRKLMKGYGAELILTPGSEGMKGSIAKAEELVKEKGYYMPMQFDNPENPNTKVYALEPSESPLLKDGKTGKHGIAAGFIPKNLDKDVYDRIVEVSTDEAMKTACEVAKNEGFLPGISAGANIHGAIELAKKLGKGHAVVTVSPDGGDRYLSTALFNE